MSTVKGTREKCNFSVQTVKCDVKRATRWDDDITSNPISDGGRLFRVLEWKNLGDDPDNSRLTDPGLWQRREIMLEFFHTFLKRSFFDLSPHPR